MTAGKARLPKGKARLPKGKARLPLGKVWLVGAGPGDPGLITVAGLERLHEADVIVYDRLASPRLLEHASEDAELVFVGKVAGKGAHNQAKINDLLIEKARENKRVVRLKGGDPFVFGRGGEEAEALRAAAVPFEVVPGVTSAAAVPAYAGIPVTHRGLASSFAVVTGHAQAGGRPAEDPGKDEPAIDWGRLATAVDTLVLLMGVKTLPEIVDRLIEGGRPAGTPVAVIQSGTTPDQRTVTGTLADIVRRVQEAKLEPPAVTVVGEVVRLRETLAWFEDRPLFGKRVLITRTRHQASALAQLLAEEGAVPIELPAIEIEPVVDKDEFGKLIGKLAQGRYAWVVFTSANAVDIFSGSLWESMFDVRVLGTTAVAAIGPETADALAFWGINVDMVPDRYVAEGLLEAFEEQFDLRGQRVLLPRAEGSRDVLIKGLRKQGAEVDEVILYRATVPREPPAEALSLLREGGIDIVTFTSSSTVRNLVALLDNDVECLRKPLVACIGPITAETARELGLRVDVEASEHTIPGLVRALRERLVGNKSP